MPNGSQLSMGGSVGQRVSVGAFVALTQTKKVTVAQRPVNAVCDRAPPRSAGHRTDGSHLQAAQQGRLAGVAGRHHNRNRGPVRGCPEAVGEGHNAEPRQVKVHQDHVGSLPFEQHQCCGTIATWSTRPCSSSDATATRAACAGRTGVCAWLSTPSPCRRLAPEWARCSAGGRVGPTVHQSSSGRSPGARHCTRSSPARAILAVGPVQHVVVKVGLFAQLKNSVHFVFAAENHRAVGVLRQPGTQALETQVLALRLVKPVKGQHQDFG